MDGGLLAARGSERCAHVYAVCSGRMEGMLRHHRTAASYMHRARGWRRARVEQRGKRGGAYRGTKRDSKSVRVVALPHMGPHGARPVAASQRGCRERGMAAIPHREAHCSGTRAATSRDATVRVGITPASAAHATIESISKLGPNWCSLRAPTLRTAGSLQGVPPSCCGRRAAVWSGACSTIKGLEKRHDAQAACEPGGGGRGGVPVHPLRLQTHRTSPAQALLTIWIETCCNV
jgi:hypothetical protein